MINVLFEASPIDPSTGVTTTVRFASATALSNSTQLDGKEWEPAIVGAPETSLSIFGNGAVQPLSVDFGAITIDLTPATANLARMAWDGALGRVWVGEAGAPFASYRQIFEGSLGAQSRQASLLTIPLYGAGWRIAETPILTSIYAGSGGLEGDAEVRGKYKPKSFGSPRYVTPVRISAAYVIYQAHDGDADDIPAVYEAGVPLAPVKARVSTYAQLIALDLQPGEWASAPAIGCFRLGAEPSGKLTCDVQQGQGTLAAITLQMLTGAGVPASSIDQATISSVAGLPWDAYVSDQAQVGEVLAQAFASLGGYLFADELGVFRAGSWLADGDILDLTIIPGSLRQEEASPPNYAVKINGDRCWSPHSSSEISPAIVELQEGQRDLTNRAIALDEAAEQNARDIVVQKQRLDSIADDSILDRSEKAQIKLDYATITANRTGLISDAQGYGLSVSTYQSAYNALKSYLQSLSPAWDDSSKDTAISRAAWDAAWQGEAVGRQNLMLAVADAAAKLANWDGVTGAGKPEDGATVGAPVGTPIAGRPAEEVVGAIDDHELQLGENTAAIIDVGASVDQAKQDITDLFLTYGNTASSAASKDAALLAQEAAETAQQNSETAAAEAQDAQAAAQAATTLALGYRDAANAAKTASETARGQASAALTDALAAQRAAQSAQTAAEAAQAEALKQATAAGGSANTASQSATNAGNSAGAAASSATVATSRANDATIAVNAAANLPSRPAVKTNFVSGTADGRPETIAPINFGDVIVVDGEGDVLECASTRRIITTRGWLPSTVGRTYRVTARYRTTVDSANNGVYIGFFGYSAAGNYRTTRNWSAGQSLGTKVVDGWVEDTRTYSPVAADAYVRAAFALNSAGTNNSGATMQLASLRFEDITSELAAAGSATAAATSASTANTKATDAGTAATAAQTAKTAAETAAGNAKTYQDNASASETNAAGSASAALSSAGVSATAQSAAERAALTSYPTTFEDQGKYFVGSRSSSAVGSDIYFETRDGVIYARNSAMSGTGEISWKKAIPHKQGNTYRIRTRLGNFTGAASTVTIRVYATDTSTAPWTATERGWTRVSVPANGFSWFEVEFTVTGSEAFVRPGLTLNSAADGTYTRCAALEMVDITSEKASRDSATASATSANTASAKATDAGQQASAAQTAKTEAETARGQASTYADNASTSATNAATSASSASTSAGVASTSADAALASAANLLPASFVQDGKFWTSGSSFAMTDLPEGWTFLDVPGKGRVAQYTGTYNIGPKGYLPVVAGHVYNLAVDIRYLASGDAGSVRYGWYLYDGSGTLLGEKSEPLVSRANDGSWAIIGRDIPGDEILTDFPTAAYIRPNVRRFSNTPVVQIASYAFTDATSVRKAETAATAAATSASNASTSAGAAGQSATAASNAQTAAETARGQAQTYASNASTSATNAAGSATTAATSAGVATTASNTAVGAAVAALPDSTADETMFTTGSTGAPADQGTITNASYATKVNDPVFGPAISLSGGSRTIAHKGAVACVPGRKYELSVRQRCSTFVESFTARYSVYAMNGDYSPSGDTRTQVNGFTATTTAVPQTLTTVINCDDYPNSKWLRITFFANRLANSATVSVIANLSVVDVTAREAAATSATAAAGSASTATSKATEAGQSATAAAGSATSANTSAGNASTSAANASTSETNAAGSKTAAANSATAAAGSATTAGDKATAAANSASSAATSATNAGTSASAANSSKTAAETAAGNAKTYQDNAATSATTANGAANTATTQAGVAATAQTAAERAALTSYPTTFEDQGKYFVGPATSSALGNDIEFEVRSGVTYARNRDPASSGYIGWKRAMPHASGNTYRVRARVGNFSGAPSTAKLMLYSHDAVSPPWAATERGNKTFDVPANDFVWIEAEFTTSATSAFIRPVIQLGVTGNTYTRCAALEMLDITSEKASRDSATASAASASTASAKATEAGQSATSATTAKNAAETAQGKAETASTNAATSASGAAGSASAAQTSATLAADYATGSRSDSAKSQANVATQQAAIATEQAAAAQSSAVLSASSGIGALNPNPVFASWSSATGRPDLWDSWNGSGFSRVQGLNSAYAFRDVVAAGTNSGIMQSGNRAGYGNNQMTPGYYVVEADVSLESGDFSGAGVILDIMDSGGSDRYLVNFTDELAGQTVVTNRMYKIRALVNATGANAYRNQGRVYLCSGYTSFGTVTAKTIVWHRCSVRSASAAEIAGNKAAADVATVQATVSQQAGAIASLEGKTAAYLNNTVTAGSSTARISMYAESSPGVKASAIEIVADAVTLGDKKALTLIGGNAVFNGSITAGAKIRMGNGAGWPVGFAQQDFSLTDGQVINYGTTFDNVPDFSFAGNNMLPLGSNERYSLYMENATKTSATFRARIVGTEAPTPVTITGDGAGSGGPTRQVTKSAADSESGSYDFVLEASGTSAPTRDGTDWVIFVNVDWAIWVRRAGVWQQVSSVGNSGTYYYTTSAARSYTLSFTGSVQIGGGSNIEAFGITANATGNGSTSISSMNIRQVKWMAKNTSTTDRSALPSGVSSTITVRPK